MRQPNPNFAHLAGLASDTHARAIRRWSERTLIGTMLIGVAAALLSGCAFEPYPELPVPPQPAGTLYGSYSALPGPVEPRSPVHRFAGEYDAKPDVQPSSSDATSPEPQVGTRAPRTPIQPEAWRGDPAAFVGPPRPGPRELTIHLNHQRFEYSEGGDVVHAGQVTTGTSEHPTPKGAYRVLSRQRDKHSGSYTNYFDMPTPMPYALQFSGPYYVHEGWIAAQPESHGCVRLHYEDARFIFERMKVGDRIAVVD